MAMPSLLPRFLLMLALLPPATLLAQDLYRVVPSEEGITQPGLLHGNWRVQHDDPAHTSVMVLGLRHARDSTQVGGYWQGQIGLCPHNGRYYQPCAADGRRDDIALAFTDGQRLDLRFQPFGDAGGQFRLELRQGTDGVWRGQLRTTYSALPTRVVMRRVQFPSLFSP